MTTSQNQTARRQSAATLAPNEAVARLRTVTDRLIEIVDSETSQIARRQLESVEALQSEKTRWANEFAMDVIDLSKVPHLLDKAPAASVSDLKSAIQKLHDRLEINGQTLAAANSVSQRLVQMITRAATESRNPTTGYGKDATLGGQTGRKPSALSLDQRI